MSKPQNAPYSAIPIPPPGGPFPTEQLDGIAASKRQIETNNTVRKFNWDGACHAWTQSSLDNRSRGIAIADKPAPFVPEIFMAVPDTDPSSGVIWEWTEPGTPVICPDLPPAKTPPTEDHVSVGTHLLGNIWSAEDDNRYAGDAPVEAISADGVTGIWKFLASPGGKGRGWYAKQP